MAFTAKLTQAAHAAWATCWTQLNGNACRLSGDSCQALAQRGAPQALAETWGTDRPSQRRQGQASRPGALGGARLAQSAGLAALLGAILSPCQALAQVPEKTEEPAQLQSQQRARQQGQARGQERGQEPAERVLRARLVLPAKAKIPPQALLTARLEDVSLADAPARVLGEYQQLLASQQDAGREFQIRWDARGLNPMHRYAIRASVHSQGQLRFISTQHVPVFQHASLQPLPQPLQIPLEAVQPAPPPPQDLGSPSERALGARLPLSFAGVLPCADCEGVKNRLSLRADGSYRLRREYLGKSSPALTEWGRWEVHAAQALMPARLRLSGAQQQSQFFALRPATARQPAALRSLDLQGRPFQSSANLELLQTEMQDEGQEPLQLRGEFSYWADAAQFHDCASGLRWPVMMAGDYLALERRYGELVRGPGAPLWVELQGRVATVPSMEGPAREHVLVDRWLSADAQASCAAPAAVSDAASPVPRPAMASLLNTYWKLIELRGQPLAGTPAQALGDFSLTLPAGPQALARLRSACGTQQLSYQLQGDTLKFAAMPGTISTCSDPARALLKEVQQALQASQIYRIEGEQLLLLTQTQTLARFESVYLH